MPRLNGAVFSANVAKDPEGRLSAHGIFAVVVASTASYEFGAPIYVVANVTDVPRGNHVFGAIALDGLSFDSDALTLDCATEDVLILLQIRNCRVDANGAHRLEFTCDGIAVDGCITLRLQPPIPVIQ